MACILNKGLARILSSRHHVLELSRALVPTARLETTVRVNPEQLRVNELRHFLDALAHLFH